MRAIKQTQRQIRWFDKRRVVTLDLAVRRPDGTFVSKHSSTLDGDGVDRCLPWIRYENAKQQADVYVRPARGHAWPVVFLDDVDPSSARLVARKYSALVIQTSRAGGCHVWLAVSRPLEESERCSAQRFLQQRLGADPGSVSGEHWGRLAGTKNHKRDGCWVNILDASDGPGWKPTFVPPGVGEESGATRGRPKDRCPTRDESTAEFAWCCHRIRTGLSLPQIGTELAKRALRRGKRNPTDYAERTIKAAQRLYERR